MQGQENIWDKLFLLSMKTFNYSSTVHADFILLNKLACLFNTQRHLTSKTFLYCWIQDIDWEYVSVKNKFLVFAVCSFNKLTTSGMRYSERTTILQSWMTSYILMVVPQLLVCHMKKKILICFIINFRYKSIMSLKPQNFWRMPKHVVLFDPDIMSGNLKRSNLKVN